MNPSIPNTPDLSDPKFAGAIDLDDVRAKAENEKAEREARAMAAAQDYADRWQRAMNRAFKGIGPTRAQRRKTLLRELEKQEGRA